MEATGDEIRRIASAFYDSAIYRFIDTKEEKVKLLEEWVGKALKGDLTVEIVLKIKFSRRDVEAVLRFMRGEKPFEENKIISVHIDAEPHEDC